MKQILLAIDVQLTFAPPEWLVNGISSLAQRLPTIASIELHDESVTPFHQQLGWSPAIADRSLVAAEKVFIKHGYLQTPETINYIRGLEVDRVLVCGIQTDTCVLAAGFALFDAGLTPTLITDLTVGSSIDRSGQLGITLWKHHFRQTTTSSEVLAALA